MDQQTERVIGLAEMLVSKVVKNVLNEHSKATKHFQSLID